MSKDEPRRLTTEERQADALHRAQEAAVASDPVSMVDALYESYALDGLTRRMRSKWHGIPADEIDFIVASAVDVLYEGVKDGEKILNIMAYLYKVVTNKAHQYYDVKRREAAAVEGFHYLSSQKQDSSEGSRRISTDEEEEELGYEERRTRACRLAKTLVPKLGQKNIQDVMMLIIEAVEVGRDDIPSTEIAEILALPAATVRQLRKRGFERLTQRAREAGVMEQDINFVNLDSDDDLDGLDITEED